LEEWSIGVTNSYRRAHYSITPLLRRCSCGREGDMVDVELELDMTSDEIEIPEDLAAALRAVAGAATASGRQRRRGVARLFVRRELIDRAVVSTATVDRCTVEVTFCISHHPVVSGGPVWRPLKAMGHTLGPCPMGTRS
jgi:hypothetical protein